VTLGTEPQLPSADRPVGDVLGTIRCLLELCNVRQYQGWLAEFHRMRAGPTHYAGYRLLFDTLLRMLASEIESDTSLGLSEDDLFARARFRGVSVGKLTNSCEKAIVIKNLLKHADVVRSSDGWDAFSDNARVFSEAVLSPMFRIVDVTHVNRRHAIANREMAIAYAAAFQVYIYLNDTSRGRPHGYLPAMLDDDVSPLEWETRIQSSMERAFPGYTLGVQYLWSRLLPEVFDRTSVRHLHEAGDWFGLDRYFTLIQEEIIKPIEEQTGLKLGFDDALLITDNPKRLLSGLLEEAPPEQDLSPRERLLRVFLWYPVKPIDASDYAFCGVPTLVPMLMGMIQARRRHEKKSKAKVVRLVHGAADDHRRDYSYAVLAEVGGLISDASGWMLFFDCCSDRGATAGLFRVVEETLTRYVRKGFVDITSIRVEKSRLLALMEEAIVRDDWSR